MEGCMHACVSVSWLGSLTDGEQLFFISLTCGGRAAASTALTELRYTRSVPAR